MKEAKISDLKVGQKVYALVACSVHAVGSEGDKKTPVAVLTPGSLPSSLVVYGGVYVDEPPSPKKG